MIDVLPLEVFDDLRNRSIPTTHIRTESSLIMKFLIGVLLIVSVVFCASSSDHGDGTVGSNETASGNETTNGNDTVKPPVPGGNENNGSASETPQFTSSPGGSNEDPSTSGASALTMEHCFLLSLPLVLFTKL
ncbi:hypothetical protein SprV_0401427500 [Sparganum proliferum]